MRPDIPEAERKFVSKMLNDSFEYLWRVDPRDGSVTVDAGTEIRSFDSFQGLAKHADSFELDEIVRLKMGFELKKKKKNVLEARRRERLRAKRANTETVLYTRSRL